MDAIARDWDEMERIADHDPHLARAVRAHRGRISQGVNSRSIRMAADRVIELKSDLFGSTNAGAATTLIDTSQRPEVDAEEEIKGIEGRLLVRMHVYRERDRKFARMVRKHYRAEAGGQLVCHACGTVPVRKYGPAGESSVEVHHKIPIEQLQPDSVSRVGDMALLCASCHRVVHSDVPCLTVEHVNELVATHLVPPTA